MQWPERIIIVDDTTTGGLLRDQLVDLSWITNPAVLSTPWILGPILGPQLRWLQETLGNAPDELKALSRDHPSLFRDRVESIRVQQPADIDRAIEELNAEGSAIAFIDFDYREARQGGTWGEIRRRFERLKDSRETPWTSISHDPGHEGGCLFSHAFGPAYDPPTRLLCPSTQQAPDEIDPHGRLNIEGIDRRAITQSHTLRGGPSDIATTAVVALQRWIEIQKEQICPLDRIWERTQGWFGSNEIQHEGATLVQLPHNLPDPAEKSGFLRAYKKTVEDVLGLELPVQWWDSHGGPSVLHESLKHMCGHYYCGTRPEGDRNLTIGSAYLMALLAMQDTVSYGEQLPPALCDALAASSSLEGFRDRLFPSQKPEVARRAARSLYFLLRNLFRREPKHGNKGLDLFRVEESGRKLIFAFGWNAAEKGLGERSLAEQLLNVALTTGTDVLDGVHATVRDAVPAVKHAMMLNRQGFGSPGAVWMVDHRLYIASANAADPGEVLIVCRDEQRYDQLAKGLLKEVQRVFILPQKLGAGRWRVTDRSSAALGSYKVKEELVPREWCCVVIHAGDRDLLQDHRLCTKKTYVVNSPGDPTALTHELPVYRSTSASEFAVTPTDFYEMIAHASGRQREIPACCVLPRDAVTLEALSLLCQGMLLVHGDPLTGKPDLPADHPAYDACQEALGVMGYGKVTWDQAMRALLPPELVDPAGRQARQRQVSDLSYWRVFETCDLAADLRKDWGSGDDSRFEAVLRLAHQLMGGEAPDLGMIAQGLCAIVSRTQGWRSRVG